MRKIYMQTLPSEKIGIIEEDGKIKELILERQEHKSEVGNIYVGKVIHVEKSLQAAFIDYGGEKNGFLNKRELPLSRDNPNKPIEQLITEGQSLTIQVMKEAYQHKGAALTANITLPGVKLIYLPYGGYVAVSKKMEQRKREEIKNYFSTVTEKNEGMIIRTSAASSSLEEAKAEFVRLKNSWHQLEKIAEKVKAPSMLWEDVLIPDRLLQRYPIGDSDMVVFDDTEIANAVRKNFPDYKEKIIWKKDLEERLSISVNQLIESIVHPVVSVTGGAELVIEQTEAMIVIDVNSGSQVKKMTKNETALQVNLNVIPEIANQIRLRNLSGIIIIDFITMKSETDRKKVINALKSELKEDQTRTELFGFTALGLLELTRKREMPPVAMILSEQTTRKTMLLSSQTRAYQLERELLQRLTHSSEAIMLDIHPEVYEIFNEIIASSRLLERKKQKVYIRITEETKDFTFRIEGTVQLVDEYIGGKSSWQVDNLF